LPPYRDVDGPGTFPRGTLKLNHGNSVG
jgi:hypothetical protein